MMNLRTHVIFIAVTLCAISSKIYCFDTSTLKVEDSVTIGDEVQTRIIGGKPASLQQFPYQAQLSIYSTYYDKYGVTCGGSLISSEWVLTAAHCVYSRSNGMSYRASVTLGIINNDNNRNVIYVPSSNFHIRSDYDCEYQRNDIALIKLPQPVQFNAYIQPINLPRRSMTKQELSGRTVTSSGWGIHDDPKDNYLLRYAHFQVVSYKDCNNTFGYIVDDCHICINAPGRSVCSGDSGGPNVIADYSGAKTLIGITSFVSPYGCKYGWPSVLTRVSHYLDWISAITSIPIRY